MNKGMKRFLSLALSFMMCLSIITIPTTAVANTAGTGLVISQVYGGGGNSGATYTHDFIELYNPTDEAISLAEYSLQYAAAAGTDFANMHDLTGTVAAKGYFLAQQGTGTSGAGIALPAPDATGTLNMGGSSGVVALVKSKTKISTTGDFSKVVDLVGYGATGTTKKFEGTGPTGTLSNSTAAIRKNSNTDTDNNAADFEVKAPNPRNSGGGAPATDCAKPTASPAPGMVNLGTQVTLSAVTTGSSIYYTTDGTPPGAGTGTSTLYSAPFALPGGVGDTVTVKAIATRGDLNNSSVATFNYTLYDANKVLTIKEALTFPAGSSTNKTPIIVEGKIAYFATSYSNPVLQELNADGKV